MELDVGTVFLQWAVGGLFFLWITTRRRLVGPGYGWLLRSSYLVLAILAVVSEVAIGEIGTARSVFLVAATATSAAALATLVVSVVWRGVPSARAAEHERRAARVGAMLHEDSIHEDSLDESSVAAAAATPPPPRREYPPLLDLAPPLIGIVGLVAGASLAGGAFPLAAVRILAGAAFLGAITDAMLLGHWYLVQPGLPRDLIRELIVCGAVAWPIEVVAWCWPPGMPRVLDGTIADGYGGIVAWMWVVCAITTIVLLGVTWLALKERAYSAVMAATGLLYLAILTAFGTDLLPRVLLS